MSGAEAGTGRRSFVGRTVMVTGGCGFIGSALARRLCDLGCAEIIVVDSLEFGSPSNLGRYQDEITLLRFTLGEDDIAALEAALERTDYLFHLAAQKHNQSADRPNAILRANVVGTHDLLVSAARAGVRRCVFSSSLYADGRMAAPPLRETDPARPATVYGITKLAGEGLVRHVHRAHGMPGLSLRYFFAYGPRQHSGSGYKSVIVSNFERLARGEPAVIKGDGAQVLDYVFVDDVIDASLLAMASDLSDDVFNVGGGRGLSVLELTERMLSVVGEGTFRHVEADWTHGTSRVADITRARESLGYEPRVSLDDGLARTWRWVKR